MLFCVIDDSTFKWLRTTNGNLPRCYGLPKIHKSEPKSHIKDSWTFVKKIKELKIEPGEVLVSLDVVSLFTNIPRNLVFQGIEKRWSLISADTALNLNQFLHAIDLVLGSTSFQFNGVCYEQIFGSSMGSPLSPIVADMVLDNLETKCISSLDFELPVFYRYVDDVFTILPVDKVDHVLHVFNSNNERLKFTMELESNNRINFLDTTVIRDSQRLITDWYRKPTFSGR
ncbi:uncharacterized protein LOC105280186 [Ooceraea biroi]|uniref:uncharacterized protein LOC105280186 n=1 Tax=Ooceraea biroi TaxID=2015173 RepID=UPI000F07FC95|nr:uncharacterized protein LOC105280186 [Ooceraea biroi]